MANNDDDPITTNNSNTNTITYSAPNDNNQKPPASTGAEEQDWVLDSLVGFLKSPLWSSSLNNFIDQMSVVFEPDDIEDTDGNVQYRAEYDSIFKQYRALVDQLITSHMIELNISEQQFAQACQLADSGMLADKLKRILFEELWAAEDYDVFVRLMTRRNVELQLEALDILAQRYGMVYDVFVPIGTTAEHFLSEEHMVNEAILRSLDDLDLDESGGVGSDSTSKTTMAKTTNFGSYISSSLSTSGTKMKQSDLDEQQQQPSPPPPSSSQQLNAEEETAELQRDKVRLEEVRQRVDRKMHEALKSALGNNNRNKRHSSGNKAESSVDVDDNGDDADDGAVKIADDDKPKSLIGNNEATTTTTTATTATATRATTRKGNDHKSASDEIAKRADYLRAQRDRIIQMKKRERTEKISKYLISEQKKEQKNELNRPKTARHSDDGGDGGGDGTQSTGTESNNKELAYRKTLAAKLKAEVFGFGEGGDNGGGGGGGDDDE